MKVADTLFAALMVTMQLPVPLQAPPQPVKVQPLAGASLSVTCAPLPKFALQVEPQLMPGGELVTVPLPVSLTESVNSCVNVAVTDSAALMVTMQLPVPLQAPPQPVNVQPLVGASFSVTCVPLPKFALQVEPQLMPVGELVTVPLPVSLTESVNSCVKVADTLFAALMVTMQLPVPLQAPPQPVNVQPLAGVSFSVTCVPLPKFALQVEPQLMPVGELVTVPLPVSLTESVNSCVNVADTLSAALMVTMQLPVPLQAPLQPVKVPPLAGVAVRVTCDPPVKLALQVEPQLIPAGVLATVPLPFTLTLSVASPPPLDAQLVTRL